MHSFCVWMHTYTRVAGCAGRDFNPRSSSVVLSTQVKHTVLPTCKVHSGATDLTGHASGLMLSTNTVVSVDPAFP